MNYIYQVWEYYDNCEKWAEDQCDYDMCIRNFASLPDAVAFANEYMQKRAQEAITDFITNILHEVRAWKKDIGLYRILTSLLCLPKVQTIYWHGNQMAYYIFQNIGAVVASRPCPVILEDTSRTCHKMLISQTSALTVEQICENLVIKTAHGWM